MGMDTFKVGGPINWIVGQAKGAIHSSFDDGNYWYTQPYLRKEMPTCIRGCEDIAYGRVTTRMVATAV